MIWDCSNDAERIEFEYIVLLQKVASAYAYASAYASAFISKEPIYKSIICSILSNALSKWEIDNYKSSSYGHISSFSFYLVTKSICEPEKSIYSTGIFGNIYVL